MWLESASCIFIEIFSLFSYYYIQVNTNHPIIHEARKNGNTLFVIAALYQAERCNIAVSFSERVDDSASVTAEGSASGVPVVGASGGGSVDDAKSSVKGVALYTLHIQYLSTEILVDCIIDDASSTCPMSFSRLD